MTTPLKLVFATGNKGKLREAREILGPGFQVESPQQEGINGEAEETGSTLEENSLLKAQYVASRLPQDAICFADDSGLEVDALGGAPGVYTARYAGPQCDFNANMDKLLKELAQKGDVPRTARFVCVVTLICHSEVHQFKGILEGTIAYEKMGDKGFGYDPVFIPNDYPNLTLAQIGEKLKNTISHRYRALSAMCEKLVAE